MRLASALALVALLSCGTPKPRPVVPPGEASCDEACTHVQTLGCSSDEGCGYGLSKDLCLRLCRNVAVNDPGVPTCLNRADTRDKLNKCGTPDDSEE